MRHVVSFSTGLSSALTVERVIDRYGRGSVDIVFMDTLIEDEDNYRFLADCQKRWGNIVILREGRTPYEVAQDAQIIANQKIAPCTFRLKVDLFSDWLKSQNFRKTDLARKDIDRLAVAQVYGAMGADEVQREINILTSGVAVHIGYDFTEVHRCEAVERNYGDGGYKVDFPLLWKPYELRPYAQVCREDWGIEPPRMYKLGYSHANCGGRCVKQGQGDWLRTLINFPKRFREAEDWEQMMRDHPVRKDYAILRDQSNGQVKPLTLRELRLRYEGKKSLQPSFLDQKHGVCVHCGVGDFIKIGSFNL